MLCVPHTAAALSACNFTLWLTQWHTIDIQWCLFDVQHSPEIAFPLWCRFSPMSNKQEKNMHFRSEDRRIVWKWWWQWQIFQLKFDLFVFAWHRFWVWNAFAVAFPLLSFNWKMYRTINENIFLSFLLSAMEMELFVFVTAFQHSFAIQLNCHTVKGCHHFGAKWQRTIIWVQFEILRSLVWLVISF